MLSPLLGDSGGHSDLVRIFGAKTIQKLLQRLTILQRLCQKFAIVRKCHTLEFLIFNLDSNYLDSNSKIKNPKGSNKMRSLGNRTFYIFI